MIGGTQHTGITYISFQFGEEIETRSFNGEVGTSVREDVKNPIFDL